MPLSQWQTYKQNKFTGENKIPAIEQLQPDQLLVAYNTVGTPDYGLQSRKGKTRLNAASLGAGPIRGLWRYVKAGGSAYLVALHGTTLYAGTWAGGTAAVTFASIKTGLSATAPLRGVVWKDNLILTNGVDNPFRYDGSTCTDLSGTPPKSAQVKVYASRLFFVDAANPNWLRWSGLESFDTWDALDVINVRDNDGDQITGLAPMPGGIVIFKRNSAWTLYGNSKDDMQLVQLSDSVGCVAPDSIIDDGVMLSYDNLWKFTLSGLQEFPQTHKSLISILTGSQRQAVKGMSVPYEKRMVWMLPNLCLNFEGATGGMTTWTDINAGALSCATGAADDGSLLIGDATNGIVYALNNENDDDGTDFFTEFWLPATDLGSTRDKVWRIFEPEISVLTGANPDGTATLTLKYNVDRGEKQNWYQPATTATDPLVFSSGDDWDAKVWGPSNTSLRWPMHNARGRRCSLRLASNSRIKFEGYSIMFREAGKLL